MMGCVYITPFYLSEIDRDVGKYNNITNNGGI